MTPLYLDHAATTPIAPEALSRFRELLEQFVANSSSGHQQGTRALALLNQARETVAKKLGCEPGEIVFTSGGTESNNWILQRVMQDASVAMAPRGVKPHLIISSIEHSSVTNVAEWLKKTGTIECTEVKPEADGRVSPQALEASIQPNTVLVSIMHGNNEIATIQDIKALGEVCRAKDVLFHSDACQTFCHTSFSARELPVDFLSLSGHKIRAPKGVGAVFIRKSLEVSPLLFGGKQERGLRPGTTSVELICAFATACELWDHGVVERMQHVRRYAIDQLRKNVKGLRVNGPESSEALCHVLSFTISGVHSKDVHRELAGALVACSTGAACGTGKSDSSAVLLGLGREPKDAHQIRISFSPTTELTAIDIFIDRLTKVLKTLETT
ncbi:cysteine desulfurase NifS [soil metagenome]